MAELARCTKELPLSIHPQIFLNSTVPFVIPQYLIGKPFQNAIQQFLIRMPTLKLIGEQKIKIIKHFKTVNLENYC